jgi:hypothetical protein
MPRGSSRSSEMHFDSHRRRHYVRALVPPDAAAGRLTTC